MLFNTAAVVAALSLGATAVPFSLPNGFPNPSPEALAKIQKTAGGTLPNTALPTELKPDAITSLKVIVINEIFETAYFNSLILNITHNATGYTFADKAEKAFILKSLRQIRAQEELHAIGANAILKSAGAQTIAPCEYKFPVTDFKSAIALAATFTDVVLGTLQAVQQGFALDGGQAASGLVPLVGSIMAQEGEQDGAYRVLQRKVPSAAPFLTASAGEFAFNAVAQNFIVSGSCGPEVAAIGIPTFKTLTATTVPEAKNGTITFSTSQTGVTTNNYVVYISGQNAPVVVPISAIATSGGMTTFKADFPFESGFSKGLTIAALTNSKGPFTSAGAVAAKTLAGPGLIEVE